MKVLSLMRRMNRAKREMLQREKTKRKESPGQVLTCVRCVPTCRWLKPGPGPLGAVTMTIWTRSAPSWFTVRKIRFSCKVKINIPQSRADRHLRELQLTCGCVFSVSLLAVNTWQTVFMTNICLHCLDSAEQQSKVYLRFPKLCPHMEEWRMKTEMCLGFSCLDFLQWHIIMEKTIYGNL